MSSSSTTAPTTFAEYSPTAYRFQAWMALAVFSAVCLSALTSMTGSNRNAAEKWCLAVSILSLLSAGAATACYLTQLRTHFVSKRAEFGNLIFQIILWSAGLPVMMNPAHNIALSAQDGSIRNANLYFFSWLSLGAVLYLTCCYMQQAAGHDFTQTATDKWYGLCLSSVVVLGSAVRAYKPAECNASNSQYCRRTQLAIAIGSICLLIAAVVTGLLHASKPLALRVEMCVTSFLLILWCFGVGYVTFGNSPGSTISNLYFFTWISFIFSVFLFARNFRETLAARDTGSQPNNESDKSDDIPHVEPQFTVEEDEEGVEASF